MKSVRDRTKQSETNICSFDDLLETPLPFRRRQQPVGLFARSNIRQEVKRLVSAPQGTAGEFTPFTEVKDAMRFSVQLSLSTC